MGINRSPGCGCCGGCAPTPLADISPTGTNNVTDGSVTVLSPTFQKYHRYEFTDLFNGFFDGTDSSRSVTMEIISDDESSVYKTFEWQYNDKWDVDGTSICDADGESEYNWRSGWGLEDINSGQQLSMITELITIPAGSSIARISSVSSGSFNSSPCYIKSHPTGNTDRPCPVSTTASQPCKSLLKSGETDIFMEYDQWAIPLSSPSIPSFKQHRAWCLDWRPDDYANSSSPCDTATGVETNVVINGSGIFNDSDISWSDGDQTKSTEGSLSIASPNVGDIVSVIGTSTCPVPHYPSSNTTTTVSVIDDSATGGSGDVSIFQSNIWTISGSSVKIQLIRDSADASVDVTVAHSGSADQTVTMAVGEYIKEVTLTAPTVTTGKEAINIDGFRASALVSELRSMRVSEDAVEFKGSGSERMVAHDKTFIDPDGNGDLWMPFDRESFSGDSFKIRLTNNGADIDYGQYTSQQFKHPKGDCYDKENSQCPAEPKVCDAKAEYHLQPMKATAFGGSIGSLLPDLTEVSSSGCTSYTTYESLDNDFMTDVYAGQVTIKEYQRQDIFSVPEEHRFGTRVIRPEPIDDVLGAVGLQVCFGPTRFIRYQQLTQFYAPSAHTFYDLGEQNSFLFELIQDATFGCSTDVSNPSQVTVMSVNRIGVNQFQHEVYWDEVTIGGRDQNLQVAAPSGFGYTNKMIFGGSCDLESDNDFNISTTGDFDKAVIASEVVKPYETSQWPVDIDIPSPALNDVYITTSPLAHLQFVEGASEYEFDGQISIVTHDDRDDVSKFSSSGLLDLVSTTDVWINIVGSTDPADDGYYKLIDQSGTLEVDVSSQTQVEPPTVDRKVGVQAAVELTYLGHDWIEDEVNEDYVEGDFTVGTTINYDHVLVGENVRSVPVYAVGDYGVGTFLLTGRDDLVMFPNGGSVSLSNINSVDWNTIAAMTDQELADAAANGTLPSDHPGATVSSTTPNQNKTFSIQLDEQLHDGYPFDVVYHDVTFEWAQAFGLSDAVSKLCCDGETSNAGTVTMSYIHFDNQPDWDPVPQYEVEFRKLNEASYVLGFFKDNLGLPWDFIGTYSRSIQLKKKWVPCWSGLPDGVSVAFSSSDIVSNQDPIYIVESIDILGDVLPLGVWDSGEYDGLAVETEIQLKQADLSSFSFNIEGLSW